MKNKSQREFIAFEGLLSRLMQVSHSEIKAKLEDEKRTKEAKKKAKATK
jgi:hypothetical protein